MGLIEKDVMAAVGATAAVLSPRVRRVARKGAVYGLAGVLKAGDVVVAAARGAARAAQSTETSDMPPAGDAGSRR
jgi:nucleoside phosphorylase